MILKLDCFLKTIFRTIKRTFKTGDNTTVSGHNYVLIEEHENCIVKISKCSHCGDIDISWKRSYDV